MHYFAIKQISAFFASSGNIVSNFTIFQWFSDLSFSFLWNNVNIFHTSYLLFFVALFICDRSLYLFSGRYLPSSVCWLSTTLLDFCNGQVCAGRSTQRLEYKHESKLNLAWLKLETSNHFRTNFSFKFQTRFWY